MRLVIATNAGGYLANADGSMPWGKCPADLQRFRQETMGRVVLMGGESWRQIGKALDGRECVALSCTGDVPKGVTVYSDIWDVLRMYGSHNVDLCGGGEIINSVCFRMGVEVEEAVVSMFAGHDGAVRPIDDPDWLYHLHLALDGPGEWLGGCQGVTQRWVREREDEHDEVPFRRWLWILRSLLSGHDLKTHSHFWVRCLHGSFREGPIGGPLEALRAFHRAIKFAGDVGEVSDECLQLRYDELDHLCNRHNVAMESL